MHHVHDASSATSRWLHWTQVGVGLGLIVPNFCLETCRKIHSFFFGEMVGFLDFGTFFSCFSLVANFFQMGNLAVESEARVL